MSSRRFAGGGGFGTNTNGNRGNLLVFRPGGTQKNNVFTTWAALVTAANAQQGPIIVLIDDSLAPAIVPAGTLTNIPDLRLWGQRFTGVNTQGVTDTACLTIQDGAGFLGAPTEISSLAIVSENASLISPSFLVQGRQVSVFDDFTRLIMNGNGRMFFTADSTFWTLILHDSFTQRLGGTGEVFYISKSTLTTFTANMSWAATTIGADLTSTWGNLADGVANVLSLAAQTTFAGTYVGADGSVTYSDLATSAMTELPNPPAASTGNVVVDATPKPVYYMGPTANRTFDPTAATVSCVFRVVKTTNSVNKITAKANGATVAGWTIFQAGAANTDFDLPGSDINDKLANHDWVFTLDVPNKICWISPAV